LKKFHYETTSLWPWESFVENLELKLTDIDMCYILKKAISSSTAGIYTQVSDKLDINLLIPGGTKEELAEFLIGWYKSVEGINDIEFNKFLLMIYKGLKPEEFLNIYIKMMQDNQWIIEKYKGCNLTELASVITDYNENDLDEGLQSIFFNKEKNNWVSKKRNTNRIYPKISLFEYFTMIFRSFNKVIFNYDGDWLKKSNLFINVDAKYLPIVKEYIEFHLSLKFDKDLLSSYKSLLNFSTDSFSFKALETLITHKFCMNRISSEEIEFLYKDGYAFFYHLTACNKNSGSFHNHGEFLNEYLYEAIDHFDFSDKKDLEMFFIIKFEGKDFYGVNGYGIRSYNNLSTKIGDKIIDKLEKECPYEFLLISDFFSNTDEKTYNEFLVFEEYEGLSDLEKLLLYKSNVKIGEEKTFNGHKVCNNGYKIFYTSEEVRKKCILEYFKKIYS